MRLQTTTVDRVERSEVDIPSPGIVDALQVQSCTDDDS